MAGALQQLADFGLALDAEFERADFDESRFPPLAARALGEARLPERVSTDDVLRTFLQERALPEQDDLPSAFGQPALTLFHGRRFYVQVLFWVDHTTSVHRHGFSGAFQVLRGASLHSEHDFVCERAVNAHLQVGQVRFLRAALLRRGDIVEITTGLAHNLFHLENPSATIVVRTYGEPAAQPQFNYSPPHMAVDPFYRDAVQTRRLQVLELLHATDKPACLAATAELLGRCDLLTAWRVLEESAYRLAFDPAMGELMAAAERRHGSIVPDRLAPSIAPLLRYRRIERLRRDVKQFELRFFLALLLNVPTRQEILAVVAATYPAADPLALVRGWLEALSGPELIGIDLADELNRLLVDSLLDGLPEERVLDRVRETYDDVEEQAAELREHLALIRRSVLQPLFETSA